MEPFFQLFLDLKLSLYFIGSGIMGIVEVLSGC